MIQQKIHEEIEARQKSKADIGPILNAKLAATKADKNTFLTETLGGRHFWIFWGDLAFGKWSSV